MEAEVPDCRTYAGMQEIEDRMEGARWNDPVEENAREINKVLDGVHRESRPRSNVDVPMV